MDAPAETDDPTRTTVLGHLDDGRAVHRLTLGTAPGPVVHLLDLGATLQRLEVSDGAGERRNVVLGRGSVEDHLTAGGRLGVTIGRYANRIAGGRLPLPDGEVALPTNDRGNTSHGGPDGFDRRLWAVEEATADRARLSLLSPDGDQGFPGAVQVELTVEVGTDEAADGRGWVSLSYTASTDATTVVNLTNHAYLALDGPGGRTDDHLIQVDASHYLPVDPTGIPLGDPSPVEGTPFDLRTPTRVGEVVRAPHEQVVAAAGLDHCLVLDHTPDSPAAVVTSALAGLQAALWTDQPGLQVYAGNKLNGTTRSADGVLLRVGDGLALEPQHLPDAPHHPAWPSPVLAPGETYRHRTTWRFSAL